MASTRSAPRCSPLPQRTSTPEISGDALCRQLRRDESTSSLPIIFLSSLGDDELATLAESAGASGYLSKQHGMDRLFEYLDETLERLVR